MVDTQQTPEIPIDPKTPTESAGSSDSWLEKQPPEVQDYIKNLRGENAKYRTTARDAQSKVDELTTAQKQAEEAKLVEQNKWKELYESEKTAREKLQSDYAAEQMKSLRLNIAAEFKLPAQLASRLQGTDEDSLRADAETLAQLIPSGSATTETQDPPARSRQTTSAVPDGRPTRETDDQKRARLNPRFNRPNIFDSVDIIVHGD